jgi:hypothetical protein
MGVPLRFLLLHIFSIFQPLSIKMSFALLCTAQYIVTFYNTPFKNICITIHYDFFQYNDICVMQQHTVASQK